MSLLNDLRPEIAAKVNADMKPFPNLHKAIVRDMKNANFVTDLPLGTANTLIDYAKSAGFESKTDSFLLKVYEIFDR